MSLVGLSGKTVMEEALADMIVDTVTDAADGADGVLVASEEDKVCA